MLYSFAIPRGGSVARARRRPRAASLVLVAGVTLATAQAVPAASAATGYLFTTDEHGSSLSRIELGTGETMTTGIAIAPRNVQATPDHQRIPAVGEPRGNNGHGPSRVTWASR